MPTKHIVQQGESIMSIAAENGMLWKTIWEDGANAQLKAQRKDPDILFPGDVVTIPDKKVKEESCATDSQHVFVKKNTPAKLYLKLVKTPQKEDDKVEQTAANAWEFVEPEAPAEETEPLADVDYALYVDKTLVSQGKSKSDGSIIVTVPPGAKKGILVLYPGTDKEQSLELNLRKMDPISELSGICKRLFNLGFDCPTDATEMTPKIQQAIAAFQRQNNLEVTGQPDDATRDRLKEVYGG